MGHRVDLMAVGRLTVWATALSYSALTAAATATGTLCGGPHQWKQAHIPVPSTGETEFSVSIPQFSFIGYDQPTFKVATQSGGVLRFMTPDIDRVEMINKILDDSAQSKYIESNDQVLKDQTKVFYESLIRSVNSDATVTFEFRP